MTRTSRDGATTDRGSSPGVEPGGAVVVDVEVGCTEPVDAERWASLLAACLVQEGVAPGATVGLSFVAPIAMAELNGEHMGATGPTDVLAFPIDGLGAAGHGDTGPPGVVGDVVLCPAVAAANAPDHAGRTEDEIALLVVHGALHLLGHDHAEPEERAHMRDRERALLALLHGPLAGDPWSEQ